MKISTRLATGFGLLIVLFILCTGIAFNALSNARAGMENAVSVKMKKSQLILDMRGSIRDMAIAVRNMALFSDQTIMQQERERLETQKSLYVKNREALSSILKIDTTPASQAAFEKMVSLEGPAMTTIETAAQLGLQNRQQEAATYLITVNRPAHRALLAALNEMTTLQIADSQSAVAENAEAVSRAQLILGVIAAFSVVVSVVTGVVIARVLMRQLGGEPAEAQKLASAIASGDLTTKVALRRNDTTSLLASLDNMQTNLRQLVTQIKASAGSVSLAADEISQGNTELSSRTEEQAAALQETASSMEQLTATVRSNTAGAQQTASAAREAARLANAGEADVKRVATTMSDISASAGKVRDITSVIESIAFQTNILALNAAVEAARAGEEGRGFAVVAGEVRTLAQRSANAARDIKQLMDEAVTMVDSGVTVAAEAGQSILKIVGMVDDLAASMDEISLASAEQMQGISQVTVAVSQMDGVTQNNATLVEESSSASQSLSEQARSLRGMVETFTV